MPAKSSSKNKSEHILNLSKHFSGDVVAFVSDKSVNFDVTKQGFRFNVVQKKFLKDKTGISFANFPLAHQVHGKRILTVKRKSCFTFFLGEADGFITKRENIPLMVRTADCLSIFMFDSKHKAVGLVHAGWRGSHKKIIVNAIKRMKKNFKTNPRDLKVVFGPSIGACCYQVGVEFKKYFPKETKERQGKLYLDVPLVNKHQLIQSGVKPKNIVSSHLCTFCDKRFFSFRRQGEKTGRMISLIMLKP